MSLTVGTGWLAKKSDKRENIPNIYIVEYTRFVKSLIGLPRVGWLARVHFSAERVQTETYRSLLN
jgi:hypothetical protein